MILLLLALQDATIDATATSPKAEIHLFKDLPDGGRGTLWSSWGDGLIASNGKYYTSIGDHRGADATSRVYEFDPATKKLRLLVDVAKAIGLKAGTYGHGKIHAAIHEFDGALWFATYWGKPREITFNDAYQGSILLRFDLKTEAVENLGAIAPKRGLPASIFDAKRGLIHFHGVEPSEAGDELVVYDLKARKVKFQGGGDLLAGKRAFMLDAKGRVWVSTTSDTLAVYDPETNKLEATDVKLPEGTGAKRGAELRASARAGGIIVGITGAGRLFSFDPEKREVKDLGVDYDYTAAMAASPDGKFVYFVPGAHGSSGRTGTQVVQLEVSTGARKVVVSLNETVKAKLGYNLGGTYNLKCDAERLYITFNGAKVAEGARKVETFGLPSLVVVDIPKGER